MRLQGTTKHRFFATPPHTGTQKNHSHVFGLSQRLRNKRDTLGLLWLIFLISIATTSPAAQQFEACGGFSEPVWDYTNRANWQPSGDAPQTRIRLVENVHFNARVEQLIRGNTAENPLGDIKYTLARFPNHPKALWAVSRGSRHPRWGQTISKPQVLCYFERAAHFNKKDSMVMLIYAMHLHQEKQFEEAKEKYVRAGQLGLDSSEYHYNYGLLLYEMGEYQNARKHAITAYTLGYPLPGLKRKLTEAGHWDE